MSSSKFLTVVFVILFVCTSLSSGTAAQVRPVYDQGALGLTQLLRRLDTNARALMIGAHPDDEDTALLAYLARGENARTAYLSLTRGDGGQNIIGTELGEALGVIRTEELLQARRLDGAEQYFTRAYDYGFSKTLSEAKEKWDEKIVLCDVVETIRAFKPQVVIARFSGTPADGHGQHQYAGYITPLAVSAASDASQCTDRGGAWTVSKLYVGHRGQGDPTLRINTGAYYPLLGRSYFEIAMHARSQHRSQEQGVLELKGDQFSQLNRVRPAADPAQKETGIFEGVDVTSGRPSLGQGDSGISGLERIVRVSERIPQSDDDPLYPTAVRALLSAAGVGIDVLADRETAVAGESVPVIVRMYTPHAEEVTVSKVEFNIPSSMTQEPPAPQSSFFRREVGQFNQQFNLAIPNAAVPTQPYWLLTPRRGDLFTIPNGYSPSRPFDQSGPTATITLQTKNRQIVVRQPVEYRYADDIRGEIRRELNIVPKITTAMEESLVIVPVSKRDEARRVSVSLTNNASGATAGKVRLIAPAGWNVVPSEADFALSKKGQKASVSFSVRLPANAATGSYEIAAEASVGGEVFSRSMQTLAYEHIQTHRMYRTARTDVKLIDVVAAPVKVGYIRGSGDRIPDAIRQLGLEVEELSEALLTSGDLSRFDTIVVGIRAYQVRPDVVANNQRLFEFANRGGTLIVQYQLPQTYAQPNLAPYPMEMGPRVSDENAAVNMIQSEHPMLNSPNKITQDDFKGWVQERNLYNFSTMDPKYVGLLESHDAGEPENKGGLVVAEMGKGRYIYCSYSLFRQLPAGVPGAYRLLANLVSAGRVATQK